MWYPFKQCGGRCEEKAQVGLRVVTRSHVNLDGHWRNSPPGWQPTWTSAPSSGGTWTGTTKITKILWRQWECLFLVRGLLKRRFYELEGHGWQYQLVILEGWRKDLMHRMHRGTTGAHLGTARTLVLLEHGFYWPGMRADMKRACLECDWARPARTITSVLGRGPLAMDVAGPYHTISSESRFCLMVLCYFLKWLECFPILDQKVTIILGKLVFDVVAQYGASASYTATRHPQDTYNPIPS